MRNLLCLAIAGLFLWLVLEPAHAQKRVALIVGNSNYEHVARLPNPTNDADAMTSTLKGAGFDLVESRRNLKLPDMRRVLRDFADKARDADVAVVYYAGHGIEVEGTNYLLPVDAVLERDADVYDEAFSLERILLTVEPAKQLRLVILDACRDNPFAKTMKRTIGTRAISRGLAKVEPTSPNTLIAYASKAGSTAADGDSRNSPFTAALVKHIATPGLDLRKAFGFVRDDVLKSTSNRQEPYVYGSLGGEDVPLVPVKPAPKVDTPSGPLTEIRRDYELALQIATREVWSAFLKQYPDGFYAALAREQLNKVAADEARAAAADKARLAQEEKARLAAEGARLAEQKKAADAAEAAEKAKRLAEERQRAEAEKAKAAEEHRAELERVAAEKAGAVEAEAARTAESKKTIAKPTVEPPAVATQPDDSQRLAALQPQVSAPVSASPSASELSRSIQTELRRVGCFTGTTSDEWSAGARRSLESFNRRAGTKLDIKLASIDALEVIKAKPSRVCPLECRHGYRADDERCVKLTCASESFVNDENECEKRHVKSAKKLQKAAVSEQNTVQTAPKSKPESSGQVICAHGSCRPISKGCRMTWIKHIYGHEYQGEVCN